MPQAKHLRVCLSCTVWHLRAGKAAFWLQRYFAKRRKSRDVMRGLIISLCVIVAACTPKTVTNNGVYRDAASPIYSIAAFDQRRLAGRWDQVAAFAPRTNVECRPGGAEFARKAGALHLTYRLCLSGRNMAGAGTVAATGPGRFAIAGKDGIDQDWWVLWVDEGYRTLVIGNPSGTFGFILNQGKTLPADRLQAAREVLDFNGYNVETLVVY